MRVYLLQTYEFEKGGARHVAQGGAFYDLPVGVAVGLIDDGKAKLATDSNELVAEPVPDAPADPIAPTTDNITEPGKE